MTVTVIHKDCKDAMRELINQGIQVDSIVTDPPYELGFMGKSWDKTGIANDPQLWRLCSEILKPGGHLLSFGGSRTYHRMASAIEDAGFEIRDQIMWVYGTGFPKSLDVSKAIDKAAGFENIVGYKDDRWTGKGNTLNFSTDRQQEKCKITAPFSDLAKQWEGWGTALKPAHEPIVLARKPLSEKTIAANVLKHGTGAINVDGCRVSADTQYLTGFHSDEKKVQGTVYGLAESERYVRCAPNSQGRFPANFVHDGSEEVEKEFPNLKSRFFYCAKASKEERGGSKHPTVKPISLMRYLCRLITPPGGTILDPFAGSGTTGQAAIEEGFKIILIEKEQQYISDINQRLLIKDYLEVI